MVHLLHIAYGIGCGMVFAGIAICSKLMTPTIPALVKVFLRFVIGGICLVPFLSFPEFKKITKQHLFLFGAMGLTLGVVFNLLFFSALKYIDPVTSALILSASPIVALLVSALLFNHIPTHRVLGGFMIALSGVALVITKGQLSMDMFSGSRGEFLMLGALGSQTVYTFLLRNMGTRFSAPLIAFLVAINGLLFLSPLMADKVNFNAIAAFTLIDWLCMLYIGIGGTALGAVLFSLAITHLGPALGSLIVFSTLPIATMAYSCIVGEFPSNVELIGGLCVLIGLALGLSGKKSPPNVTLVE